MTLAITSIFSPYFFLIITRIGRFDARASTLFRVPFLKGRQDVVNTRLIYRFVARDKIFNLALYVCDKRIVGAKSSRLRQALGSTIWLVKLAMAWFSIQEETHARTERCEIEIVTNWTTLLHGKLPQLPPPPPPPVRPCAYDINRNCYLYRRITCMC